MTRVGNLQIGKNGITDTLIKSLKDGFKNHDSMRVSVLKSFTRDRVKFKESSEEILDKLGKNYTCKKIGFTIVIKKWRKDKRE
ncbi:MAG: YhbY family RNA-binding protein [Candidatus Pacearchaeota archaeon]